MTSPPTLLPSPAAQPHGVVPRRFICYLCHIFNVNYFINPPLAPFAYNNSLYVSLLWLHSVSCILCPVSCGLYSASCVRLYTLCVTIVSAMPSNHCTAPSLYCPIVSPAYVSAAPFQLLLSPIYCRKVIPNPAPMFHALPCASCVLCPVSCFASDYALCSLCSYQHCPLSLAPHHAPLPPLVSSCTMPHSAFTTLFYPAAQQFQALRPVFFAVTASNIIGRKSLRQ